MQTTVSPTRNGYFMPEHARYQLLSVIEHLDFLSQVIAARNASDEQAACLRLRPDQLAWCFSLLARQISPVLEELEGPVPMTLH
ncbi:MAG TPA: hypothetical protein VM687_09240 [Stenotrophomonas sp.]|nr:hypothetical protein [Stenotrophomonas sp.]